MLRLWQTDSISSPAQEYLGIQLKEFQNIAALIIFIISYLTFIYTGSPIKIQCLIYNRDLCFPALLGCDLVVTSDKQQKIDG